jgi:parallel beta-helix repeat protein
MKKGASTAIIMILIMLITVSLILMSYQWLLKYSPQTQQELENSLPQKEGCLKIENIDTLNKKITIRNCGKNELSNFIIYIDDKPVGSYSNKLGPGGIIQISYTGYLSPGVNHNIKVSSNYADSPIITFIKSCDIYITQPMIPYKIDKSDTYYCLNESVHTDNQNAINFSSGVQNSFLDCQEYNIDGNGAANTAGVYLTGISTSNNIITNCNITDFYHNVHIYNGPNNIISNNRISNSDNNGIKVESTSNNVITDNIITMTKINSQGGIELSYSNNNIIFNNTITTSADVIDAISLIGSNNNIISSNTMNVVGSSSDGIWFSGSNYNTLFNNIITNMNPAHGIHISSSYNNNITGGSVISKSGFDYYLDGAGTTNNFTSTNFTAYRSIYFQDITSWFNYNNETTGNIWLKTSVSSAESTITRKLINWNQTLMQWNDSSSNAITATYNITGLIPNSNYNVYNNSIPIAGSPFSSGPSGQINFTIYLPVGQQRQIKVESAGACTDFITFLPYTINKNNTVYCLVSDLYIGSQNAINFSSGVQNTTLDCRGYNIDGNDASNTNGIYLTGSNTKNNTVNNCNVTDFDEGIKIRNQANNNFIFNNIAYSNLWGFRLDFASFNVLINNVAYNDTIESIWSRGFELWQNSNNNTLINNTAFNNQIGFNIATLSQNNTFINNTANFSGEAGFRIVDSSSNNTFINNTASFNKGVTAHGFYIWDSSNDNVLINNIVENNDYSGIYIRDSSDGNNITGGSIAYAGSYDYYLNNTGSKNYFRNTNFTSTRNIRFRLSNQWFNYNNYSTGELWLKTSAPSSTTITRKLINWNQTLMQWNDSSGIAITARYNVSGLTPNSNYIVYNNSIPIAGSPFSSGPSGQINFTIYLPASQQREIKVESAGACTDFITSLPYTISQSNRYYCVNSDLYIGSQNAISFSSGVQNTTLDCKGYNIDSNDASSTSGIYLTGSSTKNNTVKDCNITDFYRGIYLYNGPNNNTLSNNIANSNTDYGILLSSSSNNNTLTNNTINNNNKWGINLYSTSNNTLSNNTVNSNSIYGIDLSSSNNTFLSNNTVNSNTNYGIFLGFSSNNTLSNNTANSNKYGIELWFSSNNTLSNNTANSNNYGIELSSSNNTFLSNNTINNNNYGIELSSSNNTFLSNNTINNNNYGIFLSSSYNNTISGGSVALSSTADYFLHLSGTTNNFTSTNFTAARKIYFNDTTSWFNYRNDTTNNIWLKTKVSGTTTITRKLTSWSQALMQWNDSSNATITATYNITGLTPNSNYNVYNNSIPIAGSPFNSGPSGQISFTIYLPASQQREIKVESAGACTDFITSLPYPISQSNRYYCVNSDLYIGSQNAINFSSGVQNSTLDCLGYNLDGNNVGYGVYLTGSGTKNNTIKNCIITDFYYGFYLSSTTNITIINNSIINSYDNGVQLYSVSNINIINNTAVNNMDGFNLFSSSSNNRFIDNDANNNFFNGFELTSSPNNVFINNNANNNGQDGWYIYTSSSNTLNKFTNNTANSNSVNGFYLYTSSKDTLDSFENNIAIGNLYGFSVDYSFKNNITGGSTHNNIYDYGFSSSGLTNNFTNTNFTVPRSVYFYDSSSWFNYNNETTGNIWLKTSVSAESTITRKLINWNNTLMQWNDSVFPAVTARYNVTGLISRSLYDIYNNSVLTYSDQYSGDSGILSFTINLPQNQQREIKVIWKIGMP